MLTKFGHWVLVALEVFGGSIAEPTQPRQEEEPKAQGSSITAQSASAELNGASPR